EPESSHRSARRPRPLPERRISMQCSLASTGSTGSGLACARSSSLSEMVGPDAIGDAPSSPMTADAGPSAELAEARRRLPELESLVDNSPVAVIVMDADERVTDWNPAAAALFGYSSEEALGCPIDDLVFGGVGRDE